MILMNVLKKVPSWLFVVGILLTFSCGVLKRETLPGQQPEEEPDDNSNDVRPTERIEFGLQHEVAGELMEFGGLPSPYTHKFEQDFFLPLKEAQVLTLTSNSLTATCDEGVKITDIYFTLNRNVGSFAVSTDEIEQYENYVAENYFPGDVPAGEYTLKATAYSTGPCTIMKAFQMPQPLDQDAAVQGSDSDLVGYWQTDYFYEGFSYRSVIEIAEGNDMSYQIFRDEIEVLSLTADLFVDTTSRPRKVRYEVTSIHKTEVQNPPQIGDVHRCLYFVDPPDSGKYLTWQCENVASAGYPRDFDEGRRTYFKQDDSVSVPDYFVDQEARPERSIPDNDEHGISQKFEINSRGSVLVDIGVTVDIDHTSIGQLKVLVIHPDGTEIILHNRTGGNDDDLSRTWGMGGNTHGGLASLSDKPINGSWTVKVIDSKYYGYGKLNYVRLHMAGKN
jgi:subtilisin-like proprotein convertase family protein